MLSVDAIQTFYGLSHVLHGVSLSLVEGEVVALLGRNGAGKTTTLRSILGLTPPAEGEIRFEEIRLNGLKPYQIARLGIGYVPESREIFSLLSVEENLTIRRSAHSRWQLETIYELFPALSEIRSRKGALLSGGQQQMVAIGRALMTGPRLLLLDEPSQGLAPVIVDSVLEMLKGLKREKQLSLLLVEQSLRVATELADRVYFMEHGVVVHETSSKALAEDPDMAERYMGVKAA